jgi:regulatory protein
MNNERNEIRKYITVLFKFRIRTEEEIRTRCHEKGFSVECIEEVVIELKEERIIDDERFVEMYLYEGLTLKKKGLYVLRTELTHLGISTELVKDKWTVLKQKENIPELLTNWIEKEKTYIPEKWKLKMVRRGFEMEDIIEAMRLFESRY